MEKLTPQAFEILLIQAYLYLKVNMNPSSRIIYCTFWLCLVSARLNAQMLWVDPPNPSADDSITVYFDASRGNQALLDYPGQVYMHTGVITGTLDAPSSWRYIQGEWGKDDPKVRMERIGKNLYAKRLHIKRFYQLPESEAFLQLAFVFRNQDGSLVAKPEDAEEIYYPSLQSLLQMELTQTTGAGGTLLDSLLHYEAANGQVRFYLGEKQLTVWFFRENTAKVVVSRRGQAGLPPSDFLPESLGFTPTSPAIEETDSTLLCSWGSGCRLRVKKNPVRLQWLHQGKEVLSESDGFFSLAESQVCGLRFRLKPETRILGGGGHLIPLNRRGHRLYLYHTSPPEVEVQVSKTPFGLPLLMSPAGYGLLMDHGQKAYWDVGAREPNILEFGLRGSDFLRYYLWLEEPPLLYRHPLAGLRPAPLPPLWQMGYLQSMEQAGSQSDLLQQYNQLAGQGLQPDAIIPGNQWEGNAENMGSLQWNSQAFPEAEQLGTYFQQRGTHILLPLRPYVHINNPNFPLMASEKLLGTSSSGSPYIISNFPEGPSALIDIFRPEAAKWFAEKYQALLQSGASGSFLQLGEPFMHPYNLFHQGKAAENIHNLYNLEWAKVCFQAHRQQFPARRVVQLSQAGFWGIQQYGVSALMHAPQNGLRARLRAALGLQLHGIPAAFPLASPAQTSTSQHTALNSLWLSIFSPIMYIQPLPTSLNSQSRETLRKAIQLRRQLLPYNYTLAWKNALGLLPFQQSMYAMYPTDSIAKHIDDQFFWGESLLVAPFLDAGRPSRTIYLPTGNWVNFWNEERYTGKQIIELSQANIKIPVFVKSGSIIPLSPSYHQLQNFHYDSLYLHYYPHLQQAETQFKLYMDDGKTFGSYQQGAYRLLTIAATANDKKIELRWNMEGRGYPAERPDMQFVWEIHAIVSYPKTIKWMGKKLSESATLISLRRTSNSYFWDSEHAKLYLNLHWPKVPTTLTIKGKNLLNLY